MDGADTGHAVEALRRGGLVAYPTEALYALGVDIRSEAAVARLRALKGREQHKPLALLVADPKHIHTLVQDVSPVAQVLMRAFWPGPLTLIFNAAPGLPGGITAQTGTVAVRCTRHPVAAALARQLGGAITATGANVTGGRSVRVAADVDNGLRASLDAVLQSDDPISGGQCTVVDARLGEPMIVREGLISAADIARALEAR